MNNREWCEEHGESQRRMNAEHEEEMQEEYDRECQLLEQYLNETKEETEL